MGLGNLLSTLLSASINASSSYLCFLLFPCAVWHDFCPGPATPLLTPGLAFFRAVSLLTLLPCPESSAPTPPATILPMESSPLLKNTSE